MANAPYNVVRPPTFYGRDNEDCHSHWLKFQDYIEEINVDENAKIGKFKITLHGDSRMWFEDNKASFTTLALLKTAFLANYSLELSQSEWIAQFRALKLKAGESMPAYRKRVKLVAQKAKITNNVMIVSQFVGGLPDALQPHVCGSSSDNLDVVFHAAQAVNAVLPASATAGTAAAAPTAYMHQARPTPQTVDPKMDQITDDLGHFHMSKKSFSPNRGRSHSRDRDYGHYSGRSGSGDRRYRRSTSRGRESYSRPRQSTSRGRDYSAGRPRYRDDSRDPYNRRRYRSPSPHHRRYPSNDCKNVSFDKSSRFLPCDYCKENHSYQQCPYLRKALKAGKYSIEDTNHF